MGGKQGFGVIYLEAVSSLIATNIQKY